MDFQRKSGQIMAHTDLQALEANPGLKHSFGTVYHPHSQENVERMTQILVKCVHKLNSIGDMHFL